MEPKEKTARSIACHSTLVDLTFGGNPHAFIHHVRSIRAVIAVFVYWHRAQCYYPVLSMHARSHHDDDD